MDEDIMKKLAMLRSLGEQNNDEIFVSSVKEANILLQQHMIPTAAQYRQKLVDFITDPSNNVLAECDVYHNFIMDLFRTGDYVSALKVCEFALRLSPHNRDIIGDAIQACSGSSQFEIGDRYLSLAMSIPKKYWNFRLFLYSIDFLKTKLDANPENEELFQNAIDLAQEYIQFFPYDEHGYNQYAELLLSVNRREEAIAYLQRAIKEIQPDSHNRQSALICAQCCVTLLGILDDSNEYDYIVEICDIGMRNTTQVQPNSAIGFFMYRKALALDAKAHSEDSRVPSTVENALICYQVAYDLNQDRSYSKTIEQRYAILRPHATEFIPLVKRKLYVDENNTHNNSVD